MPGRNFNSNSSRYGFNGKEKDDEIKGTGNSYDFDARIYDSRLGRWLSLDPLMQKYPYFTPYAFCANNPIYLVDADGKRIWIYYMEGGKEKHFLYKPNMKGGNYPEVAQQAIKALNTIHAIERLPIVPQGFNSAEPTPKKVIQELSDDKKFNVNIHVKSKEEWQEIPQSKMIGETPAAAIPTGENESTVYWSPEIGLVETNDNVSETGLRSSPTTLLAHEVKHSWDHFKKRFRDIVNKEERKSAPLHL